MPLILRAIITGFGYKLGSELGRWAATRVGLIDKPKAQAEEAAEDLPDGLPMDPDDVGAEQRRRDEEEPN